MKRVLVALVCVLAITFVSCDKEYEEYDDSALTERVDKLEASMAKLVETMTHKLESLQTQVTKLEGSDSSTEELSEKILAIQTKLDDLIQMNTIVTEDANQTNLEIVELNYLIEDLKQQIADLKANVFTGTNQLLGKTLVLVSEVYSTDFDLGEVYSHGTDFSRILKFTENYIERPGRDDAYSYMFLNKDMYTYSAGDGANLIKVSKAHDYMIVLSRSKLVNDVYVLEEDLEKYKAARLSYLKTLPEFQPLLVTQSTEMSEQWLDIGKRYVKTFYLNNDSGRSIKINSIEVQNRYTGELTILDSYFPDLLETEMYQPYGIRSINNFSSEKYHAVWTYEVDGKTYTLRSE